MKKLYRKGTVHPTQSAVSDHLLSFLPAAILALTVALSPSDKEVLAYLISCSSSSPASSAHRKRRSDAHAPSFGCNCFGCYISYWVRWDASPNRQLIHEVIDAYEDALLKKERQRPRSNPNTTTSKRDKRKGKKVKTNDNDAGELMKTELVLNTKEERLGDAAGEEGDADVAAEEEEEEKGSVRRFVSFLGQSIWGGVWG